MKHVTCHEVNIAGSPIQLIQTGIDSFTVVYWKQVKKQLTYTQAAAEYGQCIMHALACNGKLDNRMKGERLGCITSDTTTKNKRT